MNKLIDITTKLVRISLKTLVLDYPLRTALGVLVGLILLVLSKLFYPLLSKSQYIKIDNVEEWHYILIGIFLINLPTISHMLRTRPKFDENIEKLFGVIEEGKRQGLREWQINRMYETLCENILSRTIVKDTDLKDGEIKHKVNNAIETDAD